jgi:hypothetical protein
LPHFKTLAAAIAAVLLLAAPVGAQVSETNAARESGGNLSVIVGNLGTPGVAACATDTGSCSLNALIQRQDQRLSSLIAALGTGLQVTLLGSYTPSTITGTTMGVTISATSTQVLASSARTLVGIDNESASVTIACAFGVPAVLNSAGSFTIPAGMTRTWRDYPLPTEAMNCISSAGGGGPATIENY